MYAGRAKTAVGAGETPVVWWVCCSLAIAAGSAGICGSRAKVGAGCVMLVGSRKIAYGYVMIDIGCSVDHYGLLNYLKKGRAAFALRQGGAPSIFDVYDIVV